MRNDKINWVFKTEKKSCAPVGGWVGSSQWLVDNKTKLTPVGEAGVIAAREWGVTTLGLRITYLGLQKEGEQDLVPCNPFVMTVERL